MTLARQCQERLDAAELKITKLKESFAPVAARRNEHVADPDDVGELEYVGDEEPPTTTIRSHSADAHAVRLLESAYGRARKDGGTACCASDGSRRDAAKARSKLLRAAVDAIRERPSTREIAFVFSNRERGQYDDHRPLLRPGRVVRHPARHALRPALPPRARRRGRAQGPAAPRRGAPNTTARVVELLEPFDCDLGMLAGYMLIITEPLFDGSPLLNLHPGSARRSRRGRGRT